jgi:hypothetical protein
VHALYIAFILFSGKQEMFLILHLDRPGDRILEKRMDKEITKAYNRK